MKYIKITRDTFLSGEHAQAGEIFEVDQETAALVIGAKRAVECEAPDEAVVEPPKRRVVKFTPKKAAKKDAEKETEKEDGAE